MSAVDWLTIQIEIASFLISMYLLTWTLVALRRELLLEKRDAQIIVAYVLTIICAVGGLGVIYLSASRGLTITLSTD